MDADDEDFIFYGTPIEREEELTSKKRKAAAEAAGNLRSLPSWKQEVRDEEGRRRFHGAFTGGFSAGYYNTVGSKEGWTPQSFKSSRKNRAEVKAQSVYSFLDEDEKADFEGHLGTSMQFDTFGFTAAELARSQAEKEQNKRPSAIPGPIPDELVVPAVNSIGVKLLLKMGWRHGRLIKDSHSKSLYDSRREARKAFLALSHDDDRTKLADSKCDKSDSQTVTEWSAAADDFVVRTPQSTPAFVLNPKQDMHGLGYDPFRHAPEFRERKRLQASGDKDPEHRSSSVKANLFSSNSGKVAPGFGIGAMEELDTEDEDIYASGFAFEEAYVDEDEEPSRLSKDIKQLPGKKEAGVLSGFKLVSDSEYQLERFNPPVIPPNFQPYHKFGGPLGTENKISLSDPPPPEVSPPEDNNLRILIEGFANLVTRCGKLFEDLSREKNKNNPLFSFLTGGVGHDFYARKLWEERQKHADRQKLQIDMKYTANAEKMTAESRGIILGERPLERSSKESGSPSVSTDVQLQYNLSDTFTKPASLVESLQAAKPFEGDPAKQARFEQFLKDKYQGGLRSTYSTGNTRMSEDDRARERLDFEAAAETIEKGLKGKSGDLPSNQQFMELLASGKAQFVSAGTEKNEVPHNEEKEKKRFPQRREYQWQPFPLLCKRFDILDPFLGKPPLVSRPRTKMDTLIFMPDLVKSTKPEGAPAVDAKEPSSVPQSDELEHVTRLTGKEADVEVDNANLQRPVDLYKAIFSDESDDDEENNVNQNDDAEKKTVVSSTLNRMIAGDFLESLGKELGLEVPTDSLFSIDKSKPSTSGKEAMKIDDSRISSGNDGSIPAVNVADKQGEQKGATVHEPIIPDLAEQDASGNQSEKGREKSVASPDGNGLNDGSSQNKAAPVPSWGNATYVGHLECDVSQSKMQNKDSDDKKPLRSETDGRRHRKHLRRYPTSSSSSSSFLSDYDSSDDDKKYQDHSKSKQEKRDSSRRKRRKHSKHRLSHKSKRSPDWTSYHGSSRDHKEERREKSRSKEKERAHGSLKSEAHRKYH